MAEQHTMGPWGAFTDHRRKVWLIISTADDLPESDSGKPGIASDNEADAKLIAAAPAMLKALTEIRRYSDENLGPSRSGLLSKIAAVCDAALSLANDRDDASAFQDAE